MKKPSSRFIKTVAVLLAVFAVFSCAVWAFESLTDDIFKFNTPTYIKPNSKTDGIIKNKNDYEAYIFEVPENGVLSVSLDHDNFADTLKDGWIITLYKISKVDGKEQYDEITYFKSFWSDVTASWGETGVAPGEYLIFVEPGEFILDVNFTLVLRYVKTNAYESEFNDTKETAMPVESSCEIFGSSSQRKNSNDIDWFKLTLKHDGFVNITFSHEDKSLPVVAWLVTLTSEDGTVLSDFSSKLSEPAVTSGDVSLKAGVYYVCVESQVVYGNTYSLKFDMGSVSGGEYEPNDSPEEATLIDENEYITGALAPRLLGLDKDYYKINVPKDGAVDISFKHSASQEDYAGWNVRLLKKESDGSYSEIVRKISHWNEEEFKITGIGLGAGEYYIAIDADSMKYNSAQYNLKWTFTPHSTYEKELNNTRDTANPVTFNTNWYGKLITKDVDFDNDYFSFETTEPKNVCVQLRHGVGSDSSVAWTVSIISESGEVIASVMSSKSDDVVSTGVVELENAGKYYVLVETGLVESEEEYNFIIIT